MFGGTRLTAATRSPPTASVRLRRSVVVVTTWTRSCAIPGEARTHSAIMKAKRNAIDLGMDLGKERAAKPRPFPRLQLALAGAGHPDALRHDAVDIFLRIGDGANPAIHRHTGETIGIETRQLLL